MSDLTTVYADDIPLSLAKSAHYGTSFVPEKRGEQERSSYAQSLQADWAALETLADSDEKKAVLTDEFARYRSGFRRRTILYLSAKSRVMSSMIAGPSNFPVARNRKRSDSADNRLRELLEFRERALKAIRRKLQPELRPIMAGDADATDRLAAKIAEAEKLQDAMKKANAIIRKAPKNQSTPEKVAAIVALGFAEDRAGELFKADFCGRVGFPNYALTNNNANLRRMKERASQVARAKAAPEVAIESETNGIRVEDCPPDNRVRIFFPGKPDEATRSRLKSGGFRWTPSLGCWQAYRHNHTIALAKSFVVAPAVPVPPVTTCGCPVDAPEADPDKFACPCGEHCTCPK